jgi:hypothetical protein
MSDLIFNQQELQNEYENKSIEKSIILNDLRQIIIQTSSSDALEGNSFYVHCSLNIFPELYTKQVNLFWCGKQAVTNICEIGFNAGHSTMLMLLGRDKTPLNFTIFDIGEHSYTRPCVEYIASKFNHINFTYIEGDSTHTIPVWIKDNSNNIGIYDVIHVDGGHSEHCISNDMTNANTLVKINGIIIIDDTNNDCINSYVDKYISTGKYKELNVLMTQGYPHRIIQKIEF